MDEHDNCSSAFHAVAPQQVPSQARARRESSPFSPPSVEILPGTSSDSPFIILPADKAGLRWFSAVPVCDRPQIERIRRTYATLCQIRKSCEIADRIQLNSCACPDIVAEGDRILIPATYGMINRYFDILLHSVFDFAASAFDEFALLDATSKWTIIRNFIYNFHALDNIYRALTLFPDNVAVIMGGMTSYFELNNFGKAFSDTPPTVNREEAIKMMEQYGTKEMGRLRRSLQEYPFDEEEFIASIGILLWNTGNCELPAKVHEISEGCRNRILRELDKYYINVRKEENYCVRLGCRLLQLADLQRSVDKFMESYEVHQLLGIMDDKMLSFGIMNSPPNML